MALLFKMAAINTKTAITQANKIRFRRLIGQNSQEGKLYRHNCLSFWQHPRWRIKLKKARNSNDYFSLSAIKFNIFLIRLKILIVYSSIINSYAKNIKF